jgi:periplasmic protein TonB
MTPRKLAVPLAVALIAGCAQKATTVPPAPQADAAAPNAVRAPQPAAIPAVTLEGYKKAVAARIAAQNQHMFSDPLPDMFKSIVVLDITIDRDGKVAQVGVRRSNGFKQLEARAMESVREAAPYVPPNALVRRGGGSVQFLETFLFRADGRFVIRSLIEKT